MRYIIVLECQESSYLVHPFISYFGYDLKPFWTHVIIAYIFMSFHANKRFKIVNKLIFNALGKIHTVLYCFGIPPHQIFDGYSQVGQSELHIFLFSKIYGVQEFLNDAH